MIVEIYSHILSKWKPWNCQISREDLDCSDIALNFIPETWLAVVWCEILESFLKISRKKVTCVVVYVITIDIQEWTYPELGLLGSCNKELEGHEERECLGLVAQDRAKGLSKFQFPLFGEWPRIEGT